jgi:elongation factor Ts
MHIIAMSPKFISSNDINEDTKLEYADIIKKQKAEVIKNKKQEIVDKIIQGSLNKTLLDLSLLNQKYIKNSSKIVKEDLLQYEKSLKLTIKIRLFFMIKK